MGVALYFKSSFLFGAKNMGITRVLFSGKGSLPVLERAIAFTEKRQTVLAHNLANVDTVGYKAKDLDQESFESLLQDAVEERNAMHPREFSMKSGRNISINQLNGSVEFDIYEPKDESFLRHDGNNFSYESELTKIVKNGIAHRAYTKFLKGSFDGLTKAITGR